MSIESLSKSRLWLFRLIALVIVPLAFLLCLEGGLRLFQVGHDAGYTINCEVGGQSYFCENTRFIERFFPPDIARQPVSFAYPQEKREGTFRIFVLGASAAQGDPEYSYGFSRILKLMLRETFPSLDFEIINTSISATNSHVVLPITREVSRHQPDLAIVYLGNNEVVGPFGAGTIFSPIAGNLQLIRIGIDLKATRLGQLIDSLATKIKGRQTPGRWRGMEMFLDNQVRFDAHEMKTVYSHYENNLSDIIDIFSKQNTPLIVSTVGSNLKDFPPLKSQNDPDLTSDALEKWRIAYQAGQQLLETGDTAGALAAFRRAEELDDQYAELQFLIGRCYLLLDKLSTAKEYFIRARDLDTLRFRADTRINTIIREVAGRYTSGVELVDAVELFNQESPGRIAGNELFYEHVHLNFAGNYLLAREVALQAQEIVSRLFPNIQQSASLPSREECARMLALGPFDRLRMKELIISRMISPPFTGQLAAEKRIDRLKTEYASLQQELTPAALAQTDALYRRVLQTSPDDPSLMLNYGVFLRKQGNDIAALEQFRSAAKLLPLSYKVQRYLSEMYVDLARWEESLPHFQTSLDLTRSTTDRTAIRMVLAYVQAKLQRYQASMETLRSALNEDPSAAADIYHAMAKLKMNTGELGEARDFLEQAIADQKNGGKSADIYFNYGYVLSQLNQNLPAKEAYRTALVIYQDQLPKVTDPSSRESLLVVLGRSAFAVGEIELGITYIQGALELNPLNVNHHLLLVSSLTRYGRYIEARKFLEQSLAMMSSAEQTDALRQLQSFQLQLNQKTQ